MEFLKKFDYKSLSTAQMVGLAIAALIVIYIGLSVAGTALRGVSFMGISGMPTMPGMAPVAVAPGMGYGGSTSGYAGKGGDYAYDNSASYSSDAMMPEMSARNALSASTIYPPQPTSPIGDHAEEFEVTQYNANIETGRIPQTCAQFDELKKREDVVFENANTSEHSCNYTFKVKHDSVDSVLAWLRKLNPRDISENTYTIKGQIDDFTNETEVLTAKRASIDSTLKGALTAYDEITRLATNTENADALAKIIDSKVQVIERLTQEKINIDEQLDRLSRAKALQLDKLDYTYFYVNVYENKFIDGREIRDSWKEKVRQFVQDLNRSIQELTIGLILFLLFVLQWIVYGFVLLVIAKYGWKFVRHFWNKE